MTTRPPSPSRFRPRSPVDDGVMERHRELIARIDRRGVLRGTLSVGALAMLTGCNLSQDDRVQAVLRRISEFNDAAQATVFNLNRLAPTYTEAEVIKPPRFNAHYDIEDLRPVDGASWKLELAGLITERRPWTAPEVQALPEQDLIVRHICVEGWDYIGQWSGPNLRDFLTRVGADLKAKYVAFRCADDYWESIDMATALHPQTILATRYAKETITDPFGYPLRLRTATKLGFKNPKWITAIEVTNTHPGSYYERQGFNWYSGM